MIDRDYILTEQHFSEPPPPGRVILVPSGDLRQNLNRLTWPDQVELETRLVEAIESEGYQVQRALPYDPKLGHGYIWNQRMGIDVFNSLHPEAPLVIAVSAWQYSHHVLAGLRDHRGPILTAANWSGKRPGLVGLLNLNACLTKIGKPFSTIWSEDFHDEYALEALRRWLNGEAVKHDTSHVRPMPVDEIGELETRLGGALAHQLQHEKAILAVFDEGCMGMYNAIIDDELLNPLGIYKERLSQSALLAEMQRVSKDEAKSVRSWLEGYGMRFKTGNDPQTDLTDEQIHEQCKMYIAVVRMAHEFGASAVGIQYQQGLKDMCAASDLVEGLLNNPHRPPVFHSQTGEELYPRQALPHFNEVDECAAVDMLVTNQVWQSLGFEPSATIHDLRWGEHYNDDRIDDFVWVFMISGAVPTSHLVGGYAGAVSERQPVMGFPSGGGTIKGICKPGQVVWSRIFIEHGKLGADLGRLTVVELPLKETQRRWRATTPVWPIMHAVLHGVTRDQMMARHRSNHVTVAYAPDANCADQALRSKSAMLAELGVAVNWCGV